VAATGHTQSSTTIYGLIDLGITRYSSSQSTTGSGSLVRMDGGIAQGSRMGFKGTEDLDDGLSALYVLEMGLNADDGSLGQGGLVFGRQAYMGLKDARLGALTLGRQYDFMSNLGAAYATGAQTAAGAFAWGLHADASHSALLNDHTFAGDRTNNAVKYEGKPMAGMDLGLMYGVGETAGNAQANRTISARLGYEWGRNSLGVTYTGINGATGQSSKKMFGLGGSTFVTPELKVFALATSVTDGPTRLRAVTTDVGGLYALTPAVDLSLAYQQQNRNQNLSSAHTVVAVADYKFSKRTDVYVSTVFGKDGAYRAYTVFGGGIQSSDNAQNAIRFGLRHRF
jgi:predicted porin